MKSKFKNLLISTALISSIAFATSGALVGTASASLFQSSTHQKKSECTQTMHHRPMMQKHLRMMKRFHFDHKLTPQDAQTLARARLIMHGEKNLQVGKIAPFEAKDHKAYKIEITTQNGSFVRNIVMNSKNGRVHPVPYV